MVRKELRTGLLAYNLIRQTMLQAALEADCSPRTLSFTAALQILAAVAIAALVAESFDLLIRLQRQQIADHRIGNRPGRVEPRAIKRRPKPHRLLQEPRAQARANLLAANST